ncbi:glycosyl hydrolase family 28-related protein [Pantoea anthophila]|uniref:glycosyl hydrolase family 28-related protein n=1 Tax=Pantoea anthophila TaxID=470931 RepID=UPI002DBEB62D|nr:glycosyl hydrolase family 28-related protein [Pantoea anthophila]MEB6223708.1 glycoside hydrolase family 55 protein [Pantoea anthophila]
MSKLRVDSLSPTDDSVSILVADLLSKGNADASLISAKSSAPGSVSRTILERLDDSLSVKDFGAEGDGSTDDTAAIQALIDYASANGKCVFFPAGVYMVSQLVIKAKTRMFGLGRASRLKRNSLNGLDLLYGVNSNALWGTTDANVTNFAHDVELHDMFLDGGVDGLIVPFSTSQAGSAIAIWGHDFRFYNLDIQNFADRGIRTECIDTNVDWAYTWQESSFYSIRIRNVGGHGWQFDGPHDSKFTDVSIINSSQKADNTYDNLITGLNGTGDFSGLHLSVSGNYTGNSDSLRPRYSLNLTTSCRFGGGTSIEGAYVPLRIAGGASQFDASCTYYAAWGRGSDAIAIKMEGSCGLNQVRGRVLGSESFRTGLNQYGVVFGVGTSDSVNNNLIDLTIDGCNIPISFGSSTTTPDGDKGNNTIRIKSYYGGTKTPMGTYGKLNSAGGSILEFEMSGSSNQLVRSFYQTKSQTLASGQTLTWTFKFPFPSAPVMNVSIVGPSATPTGGVWINGISGTSASIYNGSGTSVIVNATASTSVADT